MKRIPAFLLHPFLLSLWTAIAVWLILPLQMGKYTAVLQENGSYRNDMVVRYADLDGDGNSERIAHFHNSLNHAGLTVSNRNGILQQWAFRGRYDFVLRAGTVLTGDRNGDGTMEIYIFTLSSDSILLHCIPDFKTPGILFQNRFMTRVGISGNKADPYVIPGLMEDLTGDGSGELIFGIGTGYSLFPRRIFAYDLIGDSLLASPESGYFLEGMLQEDLNGDQCPEIIPYGYAASNIQDSTTPFTDRYPWLMVLDRDLDFAFQPIAFRGEYSSLRPAVIRDQNNQPYLAVVHSPFYNSGDSGTLLLYDVKGKEMLRVPAPGDIIGVMRYTDKKRRDWLLLERDKKGFEIYDASLQRRKSISSSLTGDIEIMDLDQDGLGEVLVKDLLHKRVKLYRNDFKHPVVIPFDGEGEEGLLLSVNRRVGSNPNLYLQLGAHFSFYEYGVNPSFPYRHLIFGAVYGSILLFTVLVRKLQQDQLRKKQETEKKITDLQLQIVRNQLDPHFLMNAINSIIASITDQEKEEAEKQLVHFSRLHHALLLASDKIQRSLREEISFAENYLALEKFRFREKFEYALVVEESVDMEMQVPKMILQVHLENALKHGILHLEKKGQLKITIANRENGLILEIADNGVGRENVRLREEQSTGRGLAVMEQYTSLLNRYHPRKIRTTIEDLKDEEGRSAGTRVTVIIAKAQEGRRPHDR